MEDIYNPFQLILDLAQVLFQVGLMGIIGNTKGGSDFHDFFFFSFANGVNFFGKLVGDFLNFFFTSM